jgi:hypothetical protein
LPEIKINHYIVPFGRTDESFKLDGPTWLTFVPGRFFRHTYEQKMCDYLIDLEMNYREYQIYSSQKFPPNHSWRSQTSSSMVVSQTGPAMMTGLATDITQCRYHSF